jgi:hypothetical protein
VRKALSDHDEKKIDFEMQTDNNADLDISMRREANFMQLGPSTAVTKISNLIRIIIPFEQLIQRSTSIWD